MRGDQCIETREEPADIASVVVAQPSEQPGGAGVELCLVVGGLAHEA